MDAAARQLPPVRLGLGGTDHARLPLGTLLLRDGVLSSEQLEAALAEKERTDRRLGEIVAGRGWVTPAKLGILLAEQHGLDYLDLGRFQKTPRADAASAMLTLVSR